MKRVFLMLLGFDLSLASAGLVLQANYLYRPGFWDMWWLLTVFFRNALFALLPALVLVLLIRTIPRLETRLSTGLAVGAYLSCLGGLFGGMWTGLIFVVAFVGGWIWPVETKRLLPVHLAGVGLTMFVLVHGKALLEI